MDVQLTWEIGDQDVVGEAAVVLYASGPTAAELHVDALSLDSEVSEGWASAAEAAELADHGRAVDVTRAATWFDGVWAAPDLGVSVWYEDGTSAGSIALRRGTWAFPE